MADPDDQDALDEATDEPTLIIATPNAGSEAGVRRQRRRAMSEQEKSDEFWRAVLSTETGRAEIRKIVIDQCRALSPTFAAGPVGFPDPYATWFQLGQREIGLTLYHKLCSVDYQAVVKMLAAK